MPITPGTLIIPLFAGLMVWRRFRRNIGRQPLQPKRMVLRIVVLSVATLAVAAVSLLNVPSLISLGIGLLLGAALAFLGLYLTSFENTPEGRFYTPNMYIGLCLSALFVARLAYRVIFFASAQNLKNPQAPALLHSPLTVFMFGLLASYYIAYSIGVLLRSYD
jgi:hypothetical protein